MDTAKLNALLAQKPEMVNEFPSWLVRPGLLEELAGTDGVAIAEIAGRDSVAAILAALEHRPFKAVLPTIAYTGTEYGDWAAPLGKCDTLRDRLAVRGIVVHPPVFLGSPRFWWLLCGRPVTLNAARHGLSTICLGCHLYLHALRIPLAKRIGAGTIISGERESHDGRVKLNQIAVSLDAYVDFVNDFGLELFLPIRCVREGTRIVEILGENWEEGTEQLLCVLSGNYRDEDGNVMYDSAQVTRCFTEFHLPVARKVVETYLSGETLGDVL